MKNSGHEPHGMMVTSIGQDCRCRVRPVQSQHVNFAADCLRWLRARHEGGAAAGQPWRIILVGHSMGGVVARAALAVLASEPHHGGLMLDTVPPYRSHDWWFCSARVRDCMQCCALADG